jgi:hypothetical protein
MYVLALVLRVGGSFQRVDLHEHFFVRLLLLVLIEQLGTFVQISFGALFDLGLSNMDCIRCNSRKYVVGALTLSFASCFSNFFMSTRDALILW